MPVGLSAAACRPVVFPFRVSFPAALPEGLSFAVALPGPDFSAVFPVTVDFDAAVPTAVFFAADRSVPPSSSAAFFGRAAFPTPGPVTAGFRADVPRGAAFAAGVAAVPAELTDGSVGGGSPARAGVFPRAVSGVGAASDLALLRRAAACTAVPFRAAPGLPFRAVPEVAEAVPRVCTDPAVGRAAAWAVRAPLTSPAAMPPAAPAPADPPDADCCTAIFFALMAAAPSPSVNSRANRAGTINRLLARGNGARLRFARHTRAARRASLRCAQLSAR
ncbi:hypothetical protein ACFZB5_01925 [Streptomyces nodosus]|uniref:hypothetical protein n=1 Tax=Streptomyces nodosus TaxID=40318 RepID=UPI0036EF3EF9